MYRKLSYCLTLMNMVLCTWSSGSGEKPDRVAENMLLHQRSYGGWPKEFKGKAISYDKELSEADKLIIRADKNRGDATIDNSATTKEIRYLAGAYRKTGIRQYLLAAENGIRYLLQMQYQNGGWPQFYPDSGSYRRQITFNDHAMINAMNVLWDVVHRKNDLEVVDPSLTHPSLKAIDKGIDCILKTQVWQSNKPAAWCAQYDHKTLQPAKARSFEPASLSGMESVRIVQFLMKIKNPSPAIVQAVTGAIDWFESARIDGFNFVEVKDPSKPREKDKVLLPDAGKVVWARFYDMETNRPFFAGRDGIKKWDVAGIEHERRVGYAWYGTWPAKLLEKEYPAWVKKTFGLNGLSTIVVDANGSGHFISIQSALNALTDSSALPRTIHILPGTYREKVFVRKHHIVFEGSGRENTVIVQEIARDEWRCNHPDDWGVATVNVNGNDITLKNLTVANDYGFNQKQPRTVPCALDSATGQRIIKSTGHQMALRTMKATRFKAIHCRFRAYAGDTVSPWNVENGMFYFKDCIMEGGVDLYCPRGWAWAEDCHFYAHSGNAVIWHDGSLHSDAKTVLVNCTFDGYDGFKLGRYHRDAQFYLINCNFSMRMADAAISLVPANNEIRWGKRIYFSDCHREGGDFAWFGDNLQTAPGSPERGDITIEWLFPGKWNPVSKNE